MFKRLIFIAAVFLPSLEFGQTIVYDSLGIDSTSYLNKYEIAYFDSLFVSEKYDFNSKKVAFLIGGFYAETLITKDTFFSLFKEPHSIYGRGLYILNEVEKKDSGGYDVVIIAQCKAFNPEDIVSILNGTRKKEKQQKWKDSAP